MVLQKNQLKSLREALVHKSDTVEVCTKYWISMPSIDSHCGHPVEEKAVFGQRIHPLLVSKITEMVMAGITNTTEVKRSLKFYASTILSTQLGVEFSKQNRAFFPTSVDIRNHIYAAKKSLELSKLDQENVALKIEGYKRADPKLCVFFALSPKKRMLNMK